MTSFEAEIVHIFTHSVVNDDNPLNALMAMVLISVSYRYLKQKKTTLFQRTLFLIICLS